MKSSKPKNRTRKVGFSNKVRVRNVYETFNPETDSLNVNLNEYNANADLEHSELFGYPIAHPRFVPHSKSSLVRAGRFMGNNVGWRPALSSVGNHTMNLHASMINRNTMKAYFGNRWENAEVLRNNAYGDSEAAKKAANDFFNENITALEVAFASKTGIISPSELNRIVKRKISVIEADYGSGLITKPNARASIKDINDGAQEITKSMPADDRTEYMKAWGQLKTKLMNDLKEADKIIKSYTNFGRGNPYPVVKKINLANRLQKAIAIGRDA